MSEVISRLPVMFRFVVERVDSKWVPWRIVEDGSEILDSSSEYPALRDDLGCFEADVWPLPIESKDAEVGQQFKVEGKVDIVFTRFWTDCGYEYDADYEGDLTMVECKGG